ncbi:unnamed protein product [Brassicogethes aeneus]|uniref:BHLH domain-containing protein n=1 Tax=Brassicogethes aeneus TaxID=1431903 RepID=A0A9P0BFY7_BRAAE|nr:unnamed protein product [Brassicogethes aeneus]
MASFRAAHHIIYNVPRTRASREGTHRSQLSSSRGQESLSLRERTTLQTTSLTIEQHVGASAETLTRVTGDCGSSETTNPVYYVLLVLSVMMESLLQFSSLSERLQDFTDANNNNEDSPSNIPDKYSLRPRSLRRVTASAKEFKESSTKAKSNHKQKQKAPPLSKYRRKTANARERNRMREINQAFETLRKVIPSMQTQQQLPGANGEKLTKITTLRLAMKYISSLSAALNGPEFEFSDSYSELDCFLLESDGESLPLSDNSILASPDFLEPSLSPVDFGDPSLPALLHTDFTEHALGPPDFSDFLLA